MEPLFLEPASLWGHVSRPVGLQRAEFCLPSTSKGKKEGREGGREGGRKGFLARGRFYSAPREESLTLVKMTRKLKKNRK